MATENKLSPKAIAALSMIDAAFWDEAIRVVEARIAAEDVQRKLKPTRRVKLTRPLHVPEYAERRCDANRCSSTA